MTISPNPISYKNRLPPAGGREGGEKVVVRGTSVKALLLGRRYMGFDLNERYVGIAQRRLKELEGIYKRDRHPPGGALKAPSK